MIKIGLTFKMKSKKRVAGIFCAAALALCLGGCRAAKKDPVIAEKTAAEGSATEETGAGKKLETETGAPEAEPFDSVSGQVQAPDRYTLNLENGDLTVRADAAVRVPDVGKLPVRRTEIQPLTEEEFSEFLKILTEEEGIEWEKEPYRWVDEAESEFWLEAAGLRGDVTVKARMHSAKGESGDTFSRNTSVLFQMEESPLASETRETMKAPAKTEETKEVTAGLVGKAEGLAERLAGGKMAAGEPEWMNRSVNGEKGWEDDGRILRVTFTRDVDGVPVSLHQIPYRFLEKIALFYTPDGTLRRISLTNREKIEPEQDGKGAFLLPFSEIAKIFEQVMGNTDPGELKGAVYREDDRREKTEVDIDRVELCYYSEHERIGETWRTAGKMIPAWTFYGSLTVRNRNAEHPDGITETFGYPNYAFLSISAVDGTVIEE